MGNEMNKVLTGLYIGSVRDAHDVTQLSDNKISHILSIHEHAKPDLPDMEYMCLSIADNPSQNIASYFALCNDFIHKARHKGNILVHCQMGISRSAAVVVAYLMTVSHCGWKDALGMLKSVRPYVNPNLGFQKQLMAFESELLEQERKRISQLSTTKRSEDFVESFKLLSILSCSKLEPQDRALNVNSDIYPLAKDAYGIKDSPIPLFSPTAVTFHEPVIAGADSTDVASDSMLAETEEKSSTPVSFPCKDYRSTERRRSVIEVPASASSVSEVATDSVHALKKDFHCVNEKVLGSSFAKCLSISDCNESKKNQRNKDACARARNSSSLTADAVRKIGREYLRKHVRIWHDLSDTEDDDDDDYASCRAEESATPRNSIVPSESSITEEDKKPELVDGSTQTTEEEIETESSSKFIDSTTQTLPESDDSNDGASYCKISKCLPLAKRLPKPKPVTDELAHLASQNSLDVLTL